MAQVENEVRGNYGHDKRHHANVLKTGKFFILTLYHACLTSKQHKCQAANHLEIVTDEIGK